MDIKIYISSHIETSFPKADFFIPVQAGRAGNTPYEGMLGDDTGDNISELNQYYADMSVQYWVWKNCPRSEFVGFCQWRRYFMNPFKERIRYFNIKHTDLDKYVIKKSLIEDLMRDHDIILSGTVPYRSKTKSPINRLIEIILKESLSPEDMFSIIMSMHPNLLESYKNDKRKDRIYTDNMYIMRWDLFDEYLTFLFPLLSKIESTIHERGKVIPHRAFGYLSEILFNIWLQSKSLRTVSLPIAFIEEDISGCSIRRKIDVFLTRSAIGRKIELLILKFFTFKI